MYRLCMELGIGKKMTAEEKNWEQLGMCMSTTSVSRPKYQSFAKLPPWGFIVMYIFSSEIIPEPDTGGRGFSFYCI